MSIVNSTEKRVNRITKVATILFNKHGYNRTTMNMIINDSNVSRGTVYKYYPDKLAIYEDIIKNSLEDQLSRVEMILSSDSLSFQQKVKLIIEVRIDRYQTTNKLFYKDDILLSKEMNQYQQDFLSKQKNQRLRLYQMGVLSGNINPEISIQIFSKYFDILQAGLSENYSSISLLDPDNQKSLLELIYSELLTNYKTGVKSEFTEI